jgi:hypothetical protein
MSIIWGGGAASTRLLIELRPVAFLAGLLPTSLILRLICITTASMLRLTTMSGEHRADMPDRCVSMVPAICRSV